jgi:SAM-dependent methyltransferase
MLAFRPSSVGVDVNPLNIEFCKAQGFDVFEMPFDQLPFADKTFDSVLLDNVLEHIANPIPLFAEIKRVMRVGAVLIIGVPGLKGQSSDQDHKVFYDESKLTALADQLGFDIHHIFYTPLFKSRFLSRYLRQYCIYTQWSFKA